MEMKKVQFLGWECVELATAHLTLRVTESLGPRIIYLALPGHKNLLAEVPDFVIPPPVGPYRTLGGHRLWHGPENEKRSYLPDDLEPVEITPIVNGVHVVQDTDAAGLQKIIDVQIDPDAPRVTVTQSLRNNGLWPVETYPWGLTQVRPGGFAVLPQWTKPLDEHGLIPNRSLVFWTYTRVNDPRLRLGDRYVFVHADPDNPASFKIGYENRHGWIGYHIDGTLLVKHVPYRPCCVYPDMGCSNEIYTNNFFLELEAMAPLGILAPGATATLTETWHLFTGIDFEPDEEHVDRLVASLGLDEL